jgi:hypothetical protein
VTLSPGQIQSVDLDLTHFAAQAGQRAEVRPVITQVPGAASPPVQISATLQVLDAFMGFGTVLAQAPQPGTSAPTLGPQILAGGQTMRVDVVASGPDQCVAQVGFNDKNGNPLNPPRVVNLSSGTGTSVDLNANTLGLRLGQRIEVQPVLTVTAPPAAVAMNSVCNASAEVFDHLTGRTWSHQGTAAGQRAVQ